jgi:hypothetical protein
MDDKGVFRLTIGGVRGIQTSPADRAARSAGVNRAVLSSKHRSGPDGASESPRPPEVTCNRRLPKTPVSFLLETRSEWPRANAEGVRPVCVGVGGG